MPDPNSPQQGPQNRRYDEPVSSLWMVLSKGISAAQSAPTTSLATVNPGKFRRVRWMVQFATAGTGCVLVYGRWITFKMGSTTVSKWVQDGAVTITSSFQMVEQVCSGDPVAAYITSLSGSWAAANGAVAYKLTNDEAGAGDAASARTLTTLILTGTNVGTSTSFVGDTFDVNAAGNPLSVPKGVPITIHSAQLELTNVSGTTSVTWQITKASDGTVAISDQNTDTISFKNGSTAIGSVQRDGPVTVVLKDSEDLCVRALGNAGTFDWRAALTYEVG